MECIFPFVEVALILYIPSLMAVTMPFTSTVATSVSSLSHVTVLSVALFGSIVAVSSSVSLTVNVVMSGCRIVTEVTATVLLVSFLQETKAKIVITRKNSTFFIVTKF